MDGTISKLTAEFARNFSVPEGFCVPTQAEFILCYKGVYQQDLCAGKRNFVPADAP